MGNNDFYKEKALGEMIAEGDIHRYRRKTIKIYKERRHLFAQTLKSELNDDISIEIPTGGFAFWIMIKRKISLVKWTNICKEMGLNIPKICLYQSKQLTAIRLGFAHLTEKEMKENVHILKLALDLINAEKLN
jgi:GntR family transcriptional regulator/MocR family aminotransferase